MFGIEEIRTVFAGFFFFVFGKIIYVFLLWFQMISIRRWLLFLILQPATLYGANKQ